jgi:parallel beta-helix repeat protein
VTLRVWTSAPNGGNDGNPSNDTLTTVYCVGLSGTYLVGNIPGAAFPTPDAALAIINSCGIYGPVTLSIAPGTYPGNRTLGLYTGSTHGITITSQSGVASDVVLTNTGNGNTFALNGASNVTFYGITISNPALPATGAVATSCIDMTGCTNITVSNCILKGDPLSTSSLNRAIYISGSNQVNLIGNQISDAYYGIYVSATSPGFSSDYQIAGNQMTNLYYYGIYLNRCQNIQAVANKITGSGTTYYGYYIVGSMGIVFRENELYGNMNFYGYYLSNVTGSASMPNQLINNVVSCNFSATTPRAFYFSTSATDGLDYLEMHHNSFEARVNSTSTTANGLLYFVGGSATAPSMSRLIMQNNIFRLVRAGGTFSATGLYYFSGNWLIDSTVSNYNLLHFEGQGTSPMVRVSATNYTLSAWQTTFAEDLNSLNADPLFNGVNNLTPFGLSPARNAGTPSFVTNDIAGNIRDVNPDMGAYEIQLGAADVYVETILNPPAIVQPSTLYPVTARILNASLNPLTSVRLHYQLGNQPEVVQVFPMSLLSGDSLDLTFTQSLTTPASGSLVLTVWSDLPNGISDANPGNDTARALLCQPLAGGTYTVGQSTGNDFSSFANLFEILSCGGVSGPITIQLNADNNSLNEQIIVPAIPGISANQPLILDGMGDTVTAANSQASLAVLGFRNTKHIIARNFVIKTLGTASGVIFANSDSCGLIANTILADTTSTSSTVNGIITSGSLNSTSSASLSKGLLIDSNLIQGGYYGLRLYGDAGTYSVGNTVKNNVFSDFYLYGIYTYYQDGALIRNNDISRPYRRTLSTFYGIYNLYFLRGEISANRIHNGFGSNPLGTSTVYGIYISNSPSPANQPNLIFNNLVHQMNNGTGSIYGLYHTSSSNTHWYHNTLLFDQAASTSGLVYGAYFLGTGNNNHFKNNLVSITRGGTGTKYCVYYIGTSGMISDNNALHMGSTSGSNGIGFNVTAQATLVAWRNASGGLFDMNSSDADPMFASTTTLPLVPTNWPLNNIGENLGNLVPLDFGGQVRSLTPDPGAYEFTVNGCFGILNLRSDNIQAYSARVLWASAASQWDIEYGLAGFAQGSGTSLSLSQSNAVLSGLLPNTAYQVYVREAGCSSGPGTWSTIGFTTKRDFDLSAVDLIAPTSGQCTNASLPVRMVVANTGLLPMTGYTGRVRVSGPTNATITATTTNTLAPGQKDTLLVGNLNLFPGRLASFEVSVSNPSDFFRFNDTLDVDKEFIGVFAGQDTTITPGDTATLNASIFGFASSSILNAASGANNGAGGISFNVRALQTAYIDTIYTNIYGTLGNPCTVSLWYIPSAINGSPNISTTGGWTQVHSAYATTVGNSSFTNALANTAIPLPAGFNIPAGSTYGFFLQATGGSTAYKTWASGAVDTFANNAIVIYTGTNVGYGGTAPSPGNHPRQFCGAVSVRNRAVVQWTEQGSSTVLGTGTTLRVAPALTTSYVATLVDSLCPSTDAVTVFSGTLNEITGLFRYNNTAQTPMTNSTVQLKDPQNVVVMTAPTDATGAFHLLPVAPGTYTLSGLTGKPWGGVNSVDALGTSRSFTGAAPLAGLRLKAADVNGSNTVNSLDALTTSRRFSGLVGSFSVGNWATENLPVSFSSGTITRNLLAICYGDVNGSYNPSTALRQEPKLNFVSNGIQTIGSEGHANRWVWSADRTMTFGALSVVVTLPEGIVVEAARSRMDNGNFDYHQNGRELRISWYSLEENHRKAGEPLLELDLSGLPNNGLSVSDLVIEPLSEAASPLAEVYDLTTLRIPNLKQASEFECQLYPNPSRGSGILDLRLPYAGTVMVKIWDGSGRLVAQLAEQKPTAGPFQWGLPLEGLAQGLYRVDVTLLPESEKGTKVLHETLPLEILP